MIHVARTSAEAARDCAFRIAGWILEALESRPIATVAFSGGRTPAQMLDVLRAEALDWQRIHVFQVDERAVPPDHPDSNFRMIAEHLLVPSGVPPANAHRMQGEMDARAAAALYATDLSRVLGEDPLDVVQCGVGADGHTASLFPGEPLIEDRNGAVAGVWVEKLRQWRITLLPGMLAKARHICVLATGAEKASAVRRALAEPLDPLQTPAGLLRHAEWFLDEAAAQELERGFHPGG